MGRDEEPDAAACGRIAEQNTRWVAWGVVALVLIAVWPVIYGLFGGIGIGVLVFYMAFAMRWAPFTSIGTWARDRSISRYYQRRAARKA